MFLNFLTSRLGLAGIALTLVLGLFGIQAARLHHADAELKSAQADLTKCRGSLKDANASIEARSAQSKAALEAASKAQASVTPRAHHIAEQADRLASHVVGGSDRCSAWEDAEQAVRASLQ